jgi:DNA-binding transcriptional regulator YiaG
MSGLLERARSAHRLPPPRVARAIRMAAGISQGELAAELKVHRVTVARWEDGARRPRGDLLVAYVALLDQLREVTTR